MPDLFTLSRPKATPAPRPTGPEIKGLERIVDTLAHAGRTLKWPVIRFAAGERHFRLSVAGLASREPGSVNVTTDERGFADRTYFGRIDLSGTFKPHRDQMESATAIGLALQAFASDPVGQARLYGQRFGRCCFCALELTNKSSIVAGYGPICAEKFGLPWGV